MMELFLLEHKKLWRRTSTKTSVLLCFIYVVIFGSILSFQWFSFGSSDDYTSAFGNNFDGYGMIRDRQEYSLEFGGELTAISKRLSKNGNRRHGNRTGKNGLENH